jgi:signal transduction histidine kinase
MFEQVSNQLKTYFTPEQELTPFQYYQLRMLWSVIRILLVVIVVLSIYTVFGNAARPQITQFLLLIMLLTQGVALWQVRRGHLRRAAIIEVGFVWSLIAYGSYFSGGLYATVIMLQFIPLMLAVILLGKRWALGLLLLTLALFVVLLLIELGGYLPEAPLKDLPFRMLILFIMFPTVYQLFAYHMDQMNKMEDRNVSLSALTERMKVQQELVQYLAHDLRTPLTVLNTQLYLLKTRHSRQMSIDDNLAQVEAYTQSLINMVEDFVQLTRLSKPGNNTSLDWKFFDLPDLLRNTVEELTQYANEKSVQIVFEDHSSRLCWIFGEQTYLQQVFSHLIRNGIQYGKGEGTVRVAVRDTASNAIVTIKDDGIGISEEDQNRIFEPFFRASEARTMDERIGSGMGLAIVDRIIHLHRGSVEVESVPDEGTTLIITLPLRKP